MASQTEAPQPLQAFPAESSLALRADRAAAAGVDAAHGDGSAAEVRGADNGAAAAIRIDAELKSPDLFLNRELTWLAFNRRVLHEADDERNPLLERVKFLAITASNLDEFFMKRIGGLKQQVGRRDAGADRRRAHPAAADRGVPGRSARSSRPSNAHLLPVLLKRLGDMDIHVLSFEQLTAAEQAAVREYYLRNIFPLMTPQAMDPAHPFPFISNLSLNLLVTLRYPDDAEPSLARVKVPVGRGHPALPAG